MRRERGDVMDELLAWVRAQLDATDERCCGASEYEHCNDLSALRHRELEATRRQVDLCEYLMGWTGEFNREVTEHEIQSMRFAGQEMLRFIAAPYADREGYREGWRP